MARQLYVVCQCQCPAATTRWLLGACAVSTWCQLVSTIINYYQLVSSCIWLSHQPWRALGSLCVEDHKNSGVKYFPMGNLQWKTLSTGNFTRLCVGTTWFQPLVGRMKNDVLLFAGSNLRRFSLFERGTTLQWGPSSRCSRQRRVQCFCLCSTTCLLVRLSNRSGGGTAPAHPTNSCAARAPPVVPLVGPALLDLRLWCIDNHGNISPTWISRWEKPET